MSEETKDTKEAVPGPGEGGHYSPPTKESVTHQPQLDIKPEEAEGKPAGAGGGTTDYSDYTVAELKDLAHKRGVPIHSDMLKDDIIAALEEADQQGR